ncbi:MAG: universal stress protein [Actinobacteria bacterium]|nr:universal stress protein [Actinomycetota bacterium]
MDRPGPTWQTRRVLVGYDGSEGGRDAVALAMTLAEPDAEFLLVDVIPPVGIFSSTCPLLIVPRPVVTDGDGDLWTTTEVEVA